MKKIKVLVIAPYFDKNVPGESWCTYMWVKGICERTEATVLSTHTKGWDPHGSAVQASKLVNWTHNTLTGRFSRIDHELKPHYIQFYFRARKWIKKRITEGFEYDIIHQINPVALRYPSPASGLGQKYILGPHAGSLETPTGFEKDCPEKQWFRKLRKLDAIRVRYDPILRRSFTQASLVMGVAPYLEEFLQPVPIQRFEIMAETGPDEISGEHTREYDQSGPLKLLFAGRIIRTKGVIDAIRAVAIASKSVSLSFDILGTGDMLEDCKRAVAEHGLGDIVTLHGRVSRNEVFKWYKRSEVFLFPSFREPSGTVVFEAMGFGLPLITSYNGGPGYVVTDECGIRVATDNPQQYAEDIAGAIVKLAKDKSIVRNMSKKAIDRINEVASWDNRLNRLVRFYEDLLDS